MLNPLRPGGKLPPSSGKKKTSSGDRMPTLAECLSLAGGNHFTATVLQKISHYCAHPRFAIEGQKYSAPTTRRLAEELGMSEATINKAIRKLKETEVIDTVVGRFNRSPRRYIRLLKNPVTFASTLSDGGGDEHHTLSDETVAASSDGQVGPSPAHSVHPKKKEKKKNQIDEFGPEQGPLSPEIGSGSPKVACSPPFSGEKDQARAAEELWTPRRILGKVEMDGIRRAAELRANALAYQLHLRSEWGHVKFNKWQLDFVLRCVREYRRKRAKEGPPDRWKVAAKD